MKSLLNFMALQKKNSRLDLIEKNCYKQLKNLPLIEGLRLSLYLPKLQNIQSVKFSYIYNIISIMCSLVYKKPIFSRGFHSWKNRKKIFGFYIFFDLLHIRSNFSLLWNIMRIYLSSSDFLLNITVTPKDYNFFEICLSFKDVTKHSYVSVEEFYSWRGTFNLFIGVKAHKLIEVVKFLSIMGLVGFDKSNLWKK